MKSKYFITMFILSLFLLMIYSVNAEVLPAPMNCVWADSDGGGTLSPSSACDQNGATFWETANVAYPHWIVVNLTSNFTLDGFTIFIQSFGEIPVNWDFQIANGSNWDTYQSFTNGAPCSAYNYSTFVFTKPINLNQFRLYGAVAKCGGNFMHIREVITSKGPSSPSFVVPGTISVIGWLLGLIALALFVFGAWKFPIAIFVSGIVTFFLGLHLFEDIHSIVISSFVWLLGIFVILFGICR